MKMMNLYYDPFLTYHIDKKITGGERQSIVVLRKFCLMSIWQYKKKKMVCSALFIHSLCYGLFQNLKPAFSALVNIDHHWTAIADCNWDRLRNAHHHENENEQIRRKCHWHLLFIGYDNFRAIEIAQIFFIYYVHESRCSCNNAQRIVIFRTSVNNPSKSN